MEELIAWLQPNTIFETGTYLGSSTAWFAERAPGWVRSVELDRRRARRARRRLSALACVEVVQADSAEQLARWARDETVDHDRCLFYLDAHWQARNPLTEEIEAIRAGWTRSVILIDDARVPDDDGYGFDRTSAGLAVGLEVFDRAQLGDLVALVPSVPSEEESGYRRGLLVLAEPEDAAIMATRMGLRPHP